MGILVKGVSDLKRQQHFIANPQLLAFLFIHQTYILQE